MNGSLIFALALASAPAPAPKAPIVNTINGASGNVALAPGPNVSIVRSGQTLTIAATAPAPPRRRFYLTNESGFDGSDGSHARGACDAGFHMASIWEVLQPSLLRYDTLRGFQTDDSGEGPPTGVGGWMRSGGYANPGTLDGIAYNCAAWTSDVPTDLGNSYYLNNDHVFFDPANFISPWGHSAQSCGTPLHTWCVEDEP